MGKSIGGKELSLANAPFKIRTRQSVTGVKGDIKVPATANNL